MPGRNVDQSCSHLRPANGEKDRDDDDHENRMGENTFHAMRYEQRDLAADGHHPKGNAEITGHDQNFCRHKERGDMHMLREIEEVDEEFGGDGREDTVVEDAGDEAKHSTDKAKSAG